MGMYDGNLAALDAYERRQADQERLKCDLCGNAITEDFYEIDGERFCQRCFDDLAWGWRRDINEY